MNEISLRALYRGESVYTSTGKWLHPLLDFETFLIERALDPAEIELEDKIVGKAAALLMVRLGIRTVRAGLASDPAMEVFRRNGVSCTCGQRVPRIQCMTETLLADIDDPEEARLIIGERVRASRERASKAGSRTGE